jgi:hypothetical protein
MWISKQCNCQGYLIYTLTLPKISTQGNVNVINLKNIFPCKCEKYWRDEQGKCKCQKNWNECKSFTLTQFLHIKYMCVNLPS